MTILSKLKSLFSKSEKRGSVNDPNMWINTLLESASYTSKSGAYITADTALNISTVYACVTIISQTIAALPMTINRRLPQGGNEVAEDHALFPILHDTFNREQTSFESREMGLGHLKLRGNWFNRIERDNAGDVIGIWPMHPAFMSVYRVNNDIYYEYANNPEDPADNKARVYDSSEIWHVKGFSKNGLTGMSTIQCARESIGLAKSLQDFSGTFFGNKAVPGSVLKHPGQLGPDARTNLKASMDEYANSKRHSTLILEEGMEWQSVGISNADAQFLETTTAQVRDIARWFHMPLILLQEPDNTSTYASAEQFMLSFVIHTIAPDVARIEASANRALLTDRDRKAGYYIKLNLKGLLRGDFKTRMDGYRIAREGGWYSVNDIRKLEDEPPIENGDIYLQPLNYKEAGEEEEIPKEAAPQIAEEQPEEGNEDGDEEGSQDV